MRSQPLADCACKQRGGALQRNLRPGGGGSGGEEVRARAAWQAAAALARTLVPLGRSLAARRGGSEASRAIWAGATSLGASNCACLPFNNSFRQMKSKNEGKQAPKTEAPSLHEHFELLASPASLRAPEPNRNLHAQRQFSHVLAGPLPQSRARLPGGPPPCTGTDAGAAMH